MSKIIVQIINGMQRFAPFITDNAFSEQRFDDEIQALNATAEIKPQIILLHYAVRKQETGSYIDLLLRESPMSKIVIVAESLAEDAILDILLAGAKGYIEQRDMQKLGNKMLKSIQEGEAWIGRKMVAKLLDRLRNNL